MCKYKFLKRISDCIYISVSFTFYKIQQREVPRKTLKTHFHVSHSNKTITPLFVVVVVVDDDDDDDDDVVVVVTAAVVIVVVVVVVVVL